MSYGGENWRNFRIENWRESPQHHFSAPNPNYSYVPYENRSLSYGPQRGYNPYQQHQHPAAQYAHHRPAAPYLMPPHYRPRVEEPLFITPNAGMAENAKICKADDHHGVNRKRLEEFEDFSSLDESITIDVKCSSTVCTINWSLSAKFSSVRYHLLIELYGNDRLVEKIKKDLRTTSYQFQTTPGFEYEVDVRLIGNADNNTRLKERKKFKAIFSMSEVNELFNMSTAFAGKQPEQPVQKFKYLYRVKPQIYFDDIIGNHRSVMQKYIKDENGHRASPINGEIRGLFFSGQLFSGFFPPKSPFGDKRFYVNAERLLSPESVNVYFADFYCNKNPHYVTIVVCKKGSSTDKFCKKHIKQLNFYSNPYLMVEACGGDGIKYNYYVNDNVHVEICYTEDVELNMGYFDDVIPSGIGSSTVGGLRNNLHCKTCNLRKDSKNLIGKIEVGQPQVISTSDSPEPPKSSGDTSGVKRHSSESTSNDGVDEKRTKLESNVISKGSPGSLTNSSRNPSTPKRNSDISDILKKQTPLREMIMRDRKDRKYAEPNDEIMMVLNLLVDKVGIQVDLENFQKKIQSGILDLSLLNQNFFEDIA